MTAPRPQFPTTLALALIASALLLPATPAAAQDLEGCGDFMRYVERENFPKALEELNWCRNSIEDLHFEKIKSIVDRPIEGFEPGEVTVEGAMGIATVEATYSKGSDEVRFQITGGSSAGSAASQGLGAIAGLASAFGVRSRGTDQVRVAGLTGQMKEEDGEAELVLSMEGGMILTFRGPNAAAVKAFAEDIIPDLEDYLG